VGAPEGLLRVVLDTNVLVGALLFPKGRLVWLREAWTGEQVTPLVDNPCVDELLRVLAYPKFDLTPGDIETLLGEFLPFAEPVRGRRAGRLPQCRDAHDQKFLTLADAGSADVVVTGDRALLELAGKTRFSIEKPSAFRARLEGRP